MYGLVRSGQLGSSSQKYVGSLGHESDANTGLIYMRARYMDPVLGRFLSEDPSRDGANWFVYCGGNPVNMIDRIGRYAEWMDGKDWISCLEITAFSLGVSGAFWLTCLAIFQYAQGLSVASNTALIVTGLWAVLLLVPGIGNLKAGEAYVAITASMKIARGIMGYMQQISQLSRLARVFAGGIAALATAEIGAQAVIDMIAIATSDL